MVAVKTASALVNRAIKTSDVYCAAAVYGIATNKKRKVLEVIMFAKRRDALMLARWEHTPAAVLQALSENNAGTVKLDSAITLRLDKNPNTPAQALSNLYVEGINDSKKNTSLTLLIAQHQHTPANVLASIVQFDSSLENLKAVSRNPAVSEQVLRCLVGHQPNTELYKVFDKNVATNPSAPADVLTLIYMRGDAFSRAAVIAHTNCSQSLLEQAVNDNELLVQRQLARKCSQVVVLARMAMSKDTAVRCGVATNRHSPRALIGHLLSDTACAVRRAIAIRSDLSAASIKCLKNDADHWVRLWLARNPIVSRNDLKKLSADPCYEVRRAVARNPRCPIALLEVLAKDENAWVRSAVAYQQNAPKRLMVALARELDIDVLSGVAANVHTPQRILQELAVYPEADVRRGVILNPKAKRKTLLPLLEDPYYLHRLLLVGNPMLKERDKWPLCEDPDFNVRFAAFKWFAGLNKMAESFA